MEVKIIEINGLFAVVDVRTNTIIEDGFIERLHAESYASINNLIVVPC